MSTPALEALLQAGRAEQPPEGNEERVLAALGLAVGTASGATGAAFARTAMRLWLRWMGLGVLLGAVSVTSAWAIGARSSRLAPETSTPPAAGGERDDPLAVAPVTLQGRAPPERASAVAGAHVRHARVRMPAPTASAPSTGAPAVATPADDELARITDARMALRHHDVDAALVSLDAHARAFPRGAYGEEAAALRVEALVAAGRLRDARSAADAFDAAYPLSAYGPRVDDLRRRACRPE
jgi:hypothetical protein